MYLRLFAITMLGVLLSGCFMAPMALIGPATSGFSTASIIQSGVTTGANFMVKKSTGKTISQHVSESINGEILKQSYSPQINNKSKEKYSPKNDLSSRCPKYDFYCIRILNKNPSAHSKLLKKEPSSKCKKFDFYCKRMSLKNWKQHILQDKSLLGTS